MARAFNSSTDQIDVGILTVLSGLAKASVAAWGWRASTSDTVAFGQYLFPYRFSLLHYSDGNVYTSAEDGTGTFNAYASTVTGWNHYLMVFDGTQATSGDRIQLYINGTALTRGTSGLFPTTLASGANQPAFRFGIDNSGSGDRFWGGAIAECGVWDIDLGPDDAVALSLAYSPLLVRRDHLKHYWDLIGRYSPERERMAGATGTVTGATTMDHPRMLYAGRHRLRRYSTAAAGGDSTVPQRIGIFDQQQSGAMVGIVWR